MVYKKEQESLNRKVEDLKIVAETTDFVVVNKPSGMLVHPTLANEPGTLVEYLVEKYPEIKQVGDSPDRPGIVHRLDKEASGLLVVARTQVMFEHLKKQFQDKTMEKEYFVLVFGKIAKDHDIIDFAIDRNKEGKMVSRPRFAEYSLKTIRDIQPGKESLTEFWVEKRFVRHTLLRVRIHTGRTHQIRVHMQAYNHPVVGDKLYFNRNLIKQKDKLLTRMFLHAAKLCFADLNNEKVCFEAELPEELKEFLNKLTTSK